MGVMGSGGGGDSTQEKFWDDSGDFPAIGDNTVAEFSKQTKSTSSVYHGYLFRGQVSTKLYI